MMKGPFIKSNNKTSIIMRHLLIALLPIILFSVYKNGYIPYSHGKTDMFGLFYPLIFILIGVVTTFIVELIYALVTKKNLKEYLSQSFSIFPGLFLALILPLNIPISVLIIGGIVATVVGKLVFGGFGKNIFNPALIGYIFIVAAYASVFSTSAYLNAYEIDTISTATPLTNASMVEGIGTYDELVKPYGDLNDFFIGTIPGAVGEVSAVLCLIALIYLSVVKVLKWRISITYIGTVFLITLITGRMLGQDIYYPLFHILSGGLMFGAVFMATDPVTSPVTPIGQVIYGLFLGILTVIFRFNGVEGVATSILTMNMLVFVIDKIGAKSRFNIYRSFGIFAVGILLVFIVGISLAGSKKDKDFDIISKTKNGNITVYIATQKGYNGLIKGEVKIENGKVLSYTILEQNETSDRYQLIIDNDYINKLVTEQSNIDSVDTISSATVTSKALKKLLHNVMEDYK